MFTILYFKTMRAVKCVDDDVLDYYKRSFAKTQKLYKEMDQIQHNVLFDLIDKIKPSHSRFSIATVK